MLLQRRNNAAHVRSLVLMGLQAGVDHAVNLCTDLFRNPACPQSIKVGQREDSGFENTSSRTQYCILILNIHLLRTVMEALTAHSQAWLSATPLRQNKKPRPSNMPPWPGNIIACGGHTQCLNNTQAAESSPEAAQLAPDRPLLRSHLPSKHPKTCKHSSSWQRQL